MRSRFDKELDTLNLRLIQMGQSCEEAIEKVTQALHKRSEEMAREIIREDESIDRMEKEIEQMCLRLLLMQQPVAKDLRQISAALKMITDMERIGDQTADIADIILHNDFKGEYHLSQVDKMSEAVAKMVQESIRAYVNRDLALARQVMEEDDKVDELFLQAKNSLVKVIREEQGSHGDEIVNLVMVMKYLERIGDHATNIAEWVEFSITGVHKDGNHAEYEV